MARAKHDTRSCLRLLRALGLLVVALTGCADPWVATIAVIETGDAQGDADDGVLDAGAGKGNSAARDAAAAHDAMGAAHDQAASLDPDCIGLPDLSVLWAGMPASSEVTATKGAELGCPSADAGVQLRNDIVYHLRSGERFVERGVVYSLQWPAFLPITRVRIHGGDSTCPLDPLIDVPVNLLSKGSIGVVTCQQFTAPFSSRQLHLYGNEDFTALQQFSPGPPLMLHLCRRPCLPNTQYDSDAGVEIDASTQP